MSWGTFERGLVMKGLVGEGIIILGRGLSGLITVLEDKQYMVTVREKMNNIKKVAKFYNYDFLNAGK